VRRTVQEALGSAGGVHHRPGQLRHGKGAVDYDDARQRRRADQNVRAGVTTAGRPGVTFTVDQLHYAPASRRSSSAARRAG